MRVMQLIESLEFGGAEKVVIDLANELATRHDVSICCIKRLGPLATDVDRRIQVHCLHKGEGNDFFLAFRLARLLRKHRIEVMHVHNWGAFLECALAALLARTRVRIHSVHGPYPHYGADWRSRTKLAARHFLERMFATGFTKIVTVSDSIQAYLRDDIRVAASRITTIHNGIRIATPVVPRPAGGMVSCITVGRLARIKNHDMMIRAFHEAGLHGARLYLIGDGPEREKLALLVEELGIADRVEFCGFRHDIAEQLARNDIFLMSSDYEGISIAVLEAMRASLPIIGTLVGGMAETINDGDNGILVPPRNVAAMAAALSKLAQSPAERQRMGQSGRRYLEAEFSIVTMVRRYEQLYTGEAA
ncbi:MAG: glycosyltransferase [Betaproteobacteria bacterium]